MLVKSLKNYLKSLKYVFTPLGMLAVGLVLALSVTIPIAISSIKQMCTEVMRVTGETFDFSVLFNDFITAVTALDWSDANAALGVMSTKEWWLATFEKNLHIVVDNFGEYFAQIQVLVNECISDLIAIALTIVAVVLLSYIGAFFLTQWLIRRDIAKRSFWKFIISTLFGSILTAALAAASVWLGVLWTYSLFISIPVSIILSTAMTLISAYVIQGNKKVPFKKVVNFKNIAMLLLADLIIFAIAIAITVIVLLITNVAVAIFVALGLLCVTLAVLEMNAESYVKDLAEKYKTDDTKANEPAISENDKSEKTAANS